MKKGLIVFTLLLCMVWLVLPVPADAASEIASGKCGENLTWTLDEEGTLTIFGKGAMENYSHNAAAPWNSYCDSITTVVMEDGVTSVGNFVFHGCDNLTSISIPEGVTGIGFEAFFKCTSLTSITIPEGVTTIGMSAFYGCDNLASIIIPKSVTSIEDYAFYGCSSLKTITFNGNAPGFQKNTFNNVTAKAYYPANDATWTADVMQSYGGEITWEAYDEVERFTIPSTNMTLGNSLGINFWVNKADIVDDNYYAEIIKTYADGREDAAVQIPFSEWKYNSGYNMYYITFDGIAAKEMGDELYVTVYTTDGTQASETKTDSIRDYVVRNISKWTGETRTLVMDMLNYGAAAQEYFGYDEKNPANAGLEAYQQYATQSVPVADNRVAGSNYVGSTLTLESQIILSLYFKNLTRDMNAVVTFADHYGNEKTLVIPGSKFDAMGSYLGVEVDKLVIADGGQLVTCVIYDANGKEVARAVDSVESYIARTKDFDSLTEQIMKFSASSYAYFH